MSEFKRTTFAAATMLPLCALVLYVANMVWSTVKDLHGTAEAPQQPAPPPPPPPAPSTPPPTDWDWSTTITITTIVLVTAAAGLLIAIAWHTASQRRINKRADRARRACQVELWQQGLKTLADTSTALWEFENDTESVYFTRRLLSDVNEPATATFHTAYGTAQSLRTDTIPHDTTTVREFADAAAAARRAFGAADDNARRKARLGISHADHRLTTQQIHKIDQARKLMRQAHDPATTEDNAHNALTKALSLLDDAGVIVPERLTTNVTKSIATIHRRALTQ